MRDIESQKRKWQRRKNVKLERWRLYIAVRDGIQTNWKERKEKFVIKVVRDASTHYWKQENQLNWLIDGWRKPKVSRSGRLSKLVS